MIRTLLAFSIALFFTAFTSSAFPKAYPNSMSAKFCNSEPHHYFNNYPYGNFGLSAFVPVYSKDPPHLRGSRVAITYQPCQYIWWNKLHVYFDLGYGHWWTKQHSKNHIIDIISIAPYVRYYLIKRNTISPYLEASIGLSYLTETHIYRRNLGLHFAFQDILGVGLAFGNRQQFYTTLSAVHYSNGSRSAHNAGITIPALLTFGIQF